MKQDNALPECIQPDAFINEAALRTMTEVQLANLAASQGSTPQLRSFAQQMIVDHDRATVDLGGIAARKRLPLPTSLDEEHRRRVEMVREKSGSGFDVAYLSSIVEGQRTAMTLFRRGERIRDAQISALASRSLNMLAAHDRMVHGLLGAAQEPGGGQEPMALAEGEIQDEIGNPVATPAIKQETLSP